MRYIVISFLREDLAPLNRLTIETTKEHYFFQSLRKIVEDASYAIMEVYQSSEFNIEEKSDNSPVTAADIAAHKIIIEGLYKLTPDIPVLSEEAPIDFTQRSQWPLLWVVDPLDGTKEFIKRNGEFSVNIALIENHKSVLGVVYLPVSQEGFWGVPQKRDGLPKGAIKWTQDTFIGIEVRKPESVLVNMTSRSHGANLPQPLKNKLLEQFESIEDIAKGSSIKACRIAEGKADLHLRRGPTSEWDTAASQAILEASGGHLLGVDGRPFTYNSRESLLNGHFLIAGTELSATILGWYKAQAAI